MKTVFILLLFLYGINSTAGIAVTNGLTQRHTAGKGSVVSGLIEVKNVGNKPAKVVFYKSDFLVGCDSEVLNPSDTATHERSSSAWLALGAEERILNPKEEYTLTYQFSVPNKDVSGTYWSLIMVEEKPLIDTTRTRDLLKITTNVRFAVQTLLTIPGDFKAEVAFKDIEVVDKEGIKQLSVQLFNESVEAQKIEVNLEVYNEEGELLIEQSSRKRTLYPFQCKKMFIRLEDILPGSYQAVLVADCGNANFFGVTVNLTVDE